MDGNERKSRRRMHGLITIVEEYEEKPQMNWKKYNETLDKHLWPIPIIHSKEDPEKTIEELEEYIQGAIDRPKRHEQNKQITNTKMLRQERRRARKSTSS